ncbi:hypothetical protein HGRIS_014629 [Hohenbuehelia grisea]|uniref:Uncharacterized protein n=1 Tax=Hohenbuehelia grisea TaxID=104357 RepID=A0ABR3JUY7_9AGAR
MRLSCTASRYKSGIQLQEISAQAPQAPLKKDTRLAMKFTATIFTSITFSALVVSAAWCNCVTNRGDPFRDLDQTYSVCANMASSGAVYLGSDWGGLRSARCDVGPGGSGTFTQLCSNYGSDTTAECY